MLKKYNHVKQCETQVTIRLDHPTSASSYNNKKSHDFKKIYKKRTTLTSTRMVGVKPAHTSYSTQTMPCHRMHACGNLFGFFVFKMFYLLNKKSDWRSVFTIKSLATRSSKLDLISIYFDELFWVKSCCVYCTWIAMMFTLKLLWYVSAIFFYI